MSPITLLFPNQWPFLRLHFISSFSSTWYYLSVISTWKKYCSLFSVAASFKFPFLIYPICKWWLSRYSISVFDLYMITYSPINLNSISSDSPLNSGIVYVTCFLWYVIYVKMNKVKVPHFPQSTWLCWYSPCWYLASCDNCPPLPGRQLILLCGIWIQPFLPVVW